MIFAAETFGDELLELADVEIENFCEQAERVDVFALVLRSAADRFNGEGGNGDADVAILLFPLGFGSDVGAVV